MLFVELNYTLATEEAERIGVDHIARVTTTEQCANSTVSQHLSAQHSSIKMLHSRVTVILQYIKAMQQGKHSRVTVILQYIKAMQQGKHSRVTVILQYIKAM